MPDIKDQDILEINNLAFKRTIRGDILALTLGLLSFIITSVLVVARVGDASWLTVFGVTVSGYLGGLLLGWLYNLFMRIKADKDKNAGIFNSVDLKKEKNIWQAGEGVKPYTIVFVANPAIRIADSSHLKEDPILFGGSTLYERFFAKKAALRRKLLFYRTVVRSLRSFLQNELLSIPEIFSKIRFITIYPDPETEKSNPTPLCEQYDNEDQLNVLAPILPLIDGDNIMLQPVYDYVNNYLDAAEDVDIIFVVSADSVQTQAAAHFTIDDDDQFKKFKTNLTSANNGCNSHPKEAKHPGVATLSVWDDRLKTAVHEFGHAMSSLEHGSIVDEYVDDFDSDIEDNLGLVINRKKRNDTSEPIPLKFAEYGLVDNCPDDEPDTTGIYKSDRDRTNKNSNWKSYYPKRKTLHSSCTMDIAYHDPYFDEMLFDFMYDRLTAKVNR